MLEERWTLIYIVNRYDDARRRDTVGLCLFANFSRSRFTLSGDSICYALTTHLRQPHDCQCSYHSYTEHTRLACYAIENTCVVKRDILLGNDFDDLLGNDPTCERGNVMQLTSPSSVQLSDYLLHG